MGYDIYIYILLLSIFIIISQMPGLKFGWDIGAFFNHKMLPKNFSQINEDNSIVIFCLYSRHYNLFA